MHARVRQAQPWAIDDELIVEQQVEVEGARRLVELAATAKATFDREQGIEQSQRCQFGDEDGDRVDEIGLAADSHRRRAVERGQAQYTRFGYAGERFARRPHLRQRVLEVGAQSDESLM